MNDAASKSKDRKMGLGPLSFPLGTLLAGVLLILASLLPSGDPMQNTLWTDEDSAAYDRVSQEYHRMSYQSPERAGLTEKQLAAQLEKAKTHFEALQAKLKYAQQRPLAWSRYLLWAGALLAGLGCLVYFAGDRK